LQYGGGAVFVVGDGLRPIGHLEECLAFRGAESDVRTGRGAVEIFGDVCFGLERRMNRRDVFVDGGDDAAGLVDVGGGGLGGAPAFGGEGADDSVTGFCECRIVVQA
jgi:hypothetical protein